MARLVFGEVNKKPYDPKKYKVKRNNSWRQVSLLLQPSNKKWWEDPDVSVAFNLPSSSARLERLMGTNVVKLTDRSYIQQLLESINEDHCKQLQLRIKAREMKEIERERVLIIEGKTDVIPLELAFDPIFMVNKEASDEIAKERSKLKTSREKNAEHLKQQSVKWEQERVQHAAKEDNLMWKRNDRIQQQKIIVEQYKEEDETRGMNLLRIDNEDWRECELDLKNFLISERIKMKERSLHVPTPYISDPLDMHNIMRAKKKLHQQQREELQEEKYKEKDQALQMSVAQSIILPKEYATPKSRSIFDRDQSRNYETESFIERMRRRNMDDITTDMSEESLLTDDMSSISVAKARFAAELQAEMKSEVEQGLLISKSQYDLLRYEDEKILSLRNARNIRQLHLLAEEIILGEVIEEEMFDLEGEEEGEEEDTAIELSDAEAPKAP